MSRSVFVDAEDVGRSLARRARALAGDGGLVTTYSGVEWPEGEVAPEQRVTSPRSLEILDRCHDWLDPKLERFAKRAMSGSDGLPEDLAQIARYPLLFDMAPWFCRSLVLRELLGQGEVVWMWRPESSAQEELGRLLAAGVPCVRCEWKAKASPGPSPFGAKAREVAYALRQGVRDRRGNDRWRPHRATTATRVVFAEFFPNSTEWSLVLGRELGTKAGVEVAWLAGRPEVADRLRARGVESNSIEVARFPRLAAALRPEAPASFKRFVEAGLSERRSAESGGPFEEPAGRVLEAIAPNRLLAAQRWRRVICASLRTLRPDAVVTTTYSSLFGAAVAAVCDELGIPSVYLQHGAFPARRAYSRVPQDLALVWSEYEAAVLRPMLRQNAGVSATGPVLYDDWIRRVASSPPRDASSRARVAYMASRTGGAVSSEAASRRTVRFVVDACERLGLDLTVKVHPADATRILEEEIAGAAGVKVERSRSSQDVILESDAVIVVSSTTAFEAAVAGKPIVVLNLTGAEDFTGVAEAGAALYVDNGNDLEAALLSALEDRSAQARLVEGRRRLASQRLGGGDGSATSRAATAVLALALRGNA